MGVEWDRLHCAEVDIVSEGRSNGGFEKNRAICMYIECKQ